MHPVKEFARICPKFFRQSLGAFQVLPAPIWPGLGGWVPLGAADRGVVGGWPEPGWFGSVLPCRRQHPEHTKAAPVRTYSPKAGEVSRTWHVIDATDVVLGRLASQAASLLRGKHKTTFAPHIDTGDFVVIINADKVALTGAKLRDKMDFRHSGYPGGLRATSYADLLEQNPRRAVEKAVKGMLPHNKLEQLKKLKVYAGPEHPHQAQQPQPYTISQIAQVSS